MGKTKKDIINQIPGLPNLPSAITGILTGINGRLHGLKSSLLDFCTKGYEKEKNKSLFIAHAKSLQANNPSKN